VKKTETLLLREFDEGLGDAVLRQTLVIEEVMRDDKVAMQIALRLAVGIAHINLLAPIAYGFNALGGEKDVVVFDPRTERPSSGIVIPFLHEQDARFCAGVRLEGVRVQADDGKYAAALHDELAQALLAGIVEASLRQHDRHAAARFQEVQVSLDEQEVAAYGAHRRAS
jgi:hypothetical protein